jgi:hypothetical protein
LKGLSRVRGNSHARFLEGWAGAIPPGYSTGVGVSLARKRRSPKRPSEPRPSGVHPEEGTAEKDDTPCLVRLPVGLKRDGLQKLANLSLHSGSP